MGFSERMIRIRSIRKLIRWLQHIELPGFDGIPLWYVGKFFLTGLFKGSITHRAAAISFSIIVAIFPMIIVFFSIIPFLPIENFQQVLFNFINNITPDQAEPIIQKTVVDIISRPRRGLLSFNFVLALYFASNGFDSIIEAFNNTYHTPPQVRSWLKQKLVSILLFFITSLLIIVGITLLIGGSWFLNLLQEKNLIAPGLSYYLLVGVRWLVILALFFFTFSFIYYLAPAKASKFRFISAGSSLATLLTLVATIGFNYYVQNFSTYNALYGSIGTILVIMIWVYFNAMILLIGFELNASIQHAGRENLMKELDAQKGWNVRL
ncbi:MAG: YihY/virulence factor BrkB family protein [Bacteroidales bacterium]